VGSTFGSASSAPRASPFVLVPGIGASSNYFERLAPNLNEYGPVHAPRPARLRWGPHPASKLSIAEYADLVGTVIDETGLNHPIVVGHSMGTQVVTDLAARRPELPTAGDPGRRGPADRGRQDDPGEGFG
jgi:pimeloyl-ACP methyl ester carboxylesterase